MSTYTSRCPHILADVHTYCNICTTLYPFLRFLSNGTLSVHTHNKITKHAAQCTPHRHLCIHVANGQGNELWLWVVSCDLWLWVVLGLGLWIVNLNLIWIWSITNEILVHITRFVSLSISITSYPYRDEIPNASNVIISNHHNLCIVAYSVWKSVCRCAWAHNAPPEC